ncbi:hypothetical protein ILYODFUR_025438 [Ilyodon furcidens]|uniref:TatD DNase domain containing 3 n=1 Tax=Ilyodon furcidens TaxID=33524 RepID=A0ABV0TB72_9TELE
MHGYIDCHCHISAGDFDQDVEDVIENSKKDGFIECTTTPTMIPQFLMKEQKMCFKIMVLLVWKTSFGPHLEDPMYL